MQVRTEYKIAHQYKVLKLFTLVIARSSFGREFQSLGAATIKALSPNVFDRTAGIESKILRLYKDDLNVSKSYSLYDI